MTSATRKRTEASRERFRRAGKARAALHAAHPRFRPTIMFDGIGTAAAALGVSKFWLRNVLLGRHRSQSLIEDCLRQFPALVPPETAAKYDLPPTNTAT